MGQPIPVHDAWKEHLVATRTSTGQIYLLLSIERTVCDNCRFGTVFNTIWGSPSGDMQRIVWCSTCFNADCDPTDADETAHRAWNRIIQRLDRERNFTCWNGAKAAVEELERLALI